MQELSGLDASFLFLENDKLPMHIGAVSILEGPLSFDDFKHFLRQRVHLVEKLSQKIATVPFNLDRPVWIDDPDFDIDMHIHQVLLAEPGDWTELRKLASAIFSEKLDHSRPLWDFTFVEGLNNIARVPKASVALISKVHHAGFDGMSGTALMNMLFDVSATPKPIPIRHTKRHVSLPGSIQLVQRSVMNLVSRPVKLPKLLWESSKLAVKTSFLATINKIDLPSLPFQAPYTSFNQHVEQPRCWNSAILDLKRVKALRKAVDGASLNDVILAICAGALRRYLLERHELPDKPLIAMIPVSTRSKTDKTAMGNQLSTMYIQLATDISDPLLRLEKIYRNTLVAKLYQHTSDTNTLMGVSEIIPFGIAAMATRLYSRAALKKLHKPIVNLVITNVPGPPVPLYLAGHKLLLNMGMAPIYDGMGLIIPVCSYNGTLSLSPTSAVNLMPDLHKFTQYLRESANEMESLVQEKLAAKAAFAKLLE